MKKNWILKFGLATMCLGFTLTSCSDDETNGDGGGGTDREAGDMYVIAATVDDAAYLVLADTISSGQVSVINNGKETETSTYWIFKDKEMLIRLVYNQGNSGTGSTYYLDANGNIVEGSTFAALRFTTYGLWGENVITASAGATATTDANGYSAYGILANYFNTTSGELTTNTYISENFLGNGEYVGFAGFVEANDKLYTSVIPMGMSLYGIAAWPELVTDTALIASADGGSNSSAYTAGTIPSTQFPDSAFVAIYSGDDFSEAPTILRTGKIGFACGRNRSQYYQTIWAADNGDIYVFSSGYGRLTTSSDELKRVTGELPSGVVRIKAGESDFDADYYYNLEELGNKHELYRCWHITDDYFLLQFYTDGLNARGTNTLELGVFRGSTGELTMVTGLPDASILSSFGTNPFAEDDAIYMPVTTTEGSPALYRIEASTAVATKGIEIEADAVNAVGLLSPQK